VFVVLLLQLLRIAPVAPIADRKGGHYWLIVANKSVVTPFSSVTHGELKALQQAPEKERHLMEEYRKRVKAREAKAQDSGTADERG
jgi:hypothetical protein